MSQSPELGPKHYVPVLKIKRGEKEALGLLHTNHRRRIMPLLEVVERAPAKMPEEHLFTAFRGLAASLDRYPRCLLDAREVASDGEAFAERIFSRAEQDGIRFTPVTGLRRTADLAPALRRRQGGIAIRLERRDLRSGGLAAQLLGFLRTHALTANEVDLVMDLGPVEEMIGPGVAALAAEFLRAVPTHSAWRTFTLSACGFPLGLGVADRYSHRLAERVDWLGWRDGVYAKRAAIERVPTYSDCGIQHTKGVEGFDPLTMQIAATIRYALAGDWLLIKGESTRRTPASEQYPVLAGQLADGHLKQHYFGWDHCAGCTSIRDSAAGKPRLGSPGVWRRLGTIHHLVTTVEALADLPGP